jgi:hypothetical protein
MGVLYGGTFKPKRRGMKRPTRDAKVHESLLNNSNAETTQLKMAIYRLMTAIGLTSPKDALIEFNEYLRQ